MDVGGSGCHVSEHLYAWDSGMRHDQKINDVMEALAWNGFAFSESTEWSDTPLTTMSLHSDLLRLQSETVFSVWSCRADQPFINSRRWELIVKTANVFTRQEAASARLSPSCYLTSQSCLIVSPLHLSWWKTIVCIHFLPPLFPLPLLCLPVGAQLAAL